MTSEKNICSELNNFFFAVGSKLASKLPTPNREFTHYMSPPLRDSFFCSNITTFEIEQELGRLKVNKKASLEGYNTSIIVEASNIISYPLCYIFNKSLSSGLVPQDLKLAKIIPIYKKRRSYFSCELSSYINIINV